MTLIISQGRFRGIQFTHTRAHTHIHTRARTRTHTQCYTRYRQFNQRNASQHKHNQHHHHTTIIIITATTMVLLLQCQGCARQQRRVQYEGKERKVCVGMWGGGRGEVGMGCEAGCDSCIKKRPLKFMWISMSTHFALPTIDAPCVLCRRRASDSTVLSDLDSTLKTRSGNTMLSILNETSTFLRV